jgi:hypothetical protein
LIGAGYIFVESGGMLGYKVYILPSLSEYEPWQLTEGKVGELKKF